jgi:hypothetical protein
MRGRVIVFVIGVGIVIVIVIGMGGCQRAGRPTWWRGRRIGGRAEGSFRDGLPLRRSIWFVR